MFRRLIQLNWQKMLLKRTFTSVKPLRGKDVISKAANPSKLIFLMNGSSLLIKNTTKDIDLYLQEACDAGESAIIEIMDVLKEQIIIVGDSYKKCLMKQMEIMKESEELGRLTERWDDLPEYRSLAIELNEELSKFIVVLNTITAMAHDESIKYFTQRKDHINLVAKKCKDLESIVKKQSEEIKSLEAAIIKLKREIILKIT